MQPGSMNDQFEVNAFDGYYASLAEVGDNYVVRVELRGDGMGVAAFELAQYPENRSGEAERFFYLVQGLCRYLNAGGTFGQMASAAEQLHELSAHIQVEFPAPWKVFSVLYEVEDPTLILVNEETQRAQVVKESQYTESMSLSDLNNQLGEWGT